MKWYSNFKNKTPLKKIIALQRLEDEKFTKREQLIKFEWKIEALKGTAKVLYCQYGLP
jgi:hypothetical protein